MITVWHNSEFLQLRLRELLTGELPKVIPEHDLTPVAFVDTKDLEVAWELTQNLERNWIDCLGATALVKNCRSTDIGDVLQRADNCCFVVAHQGFQPLDMQLPYVALTKKCYATGELYEEFPSLDLPSWNQQKVLEHIALPSNPRTYKELRCWNDGQARWLLRFYK